MSEHAEQRLAWKAESHCVAVIRRVTVKMLPPGFSYLRLMKISPQIDRQPKRVVVAP